MSGVVVVTGGDGLDALRSAPVLTERLSQERLEYELGKVDDLREPPVPVVAWLAVDSSNHEGLFYGWAETPNGADDGWRGLVSAVREYAAGFEAEYLGWERAEHITRADG